jgi:HEAT repeat protein
LASRDADESVRIASLRALGRLADKSAVLPIVSLLEEFPPEPVQVAALDALAQIGGAESLDALLEVLGSDHPQAERDAARAALVRVGEPALERLERCVAGQPDARLADGCVLALGELGSVRAANVVIDALRRNSARPEAVLQALGRIGRVESLPTVLEFLTHAQPGVRRAAIDAAMVLLEPSRPDGRAVDPIVLALDRARADAAERIELVRLLGRTGSPRAVKALAPLAKNADDHELRLAAIAALGLLGPSGQDPVLLAALDDDEPSIRLAAALALRRSGAAPTATQLLERLDQAATQDRAALAIALSGPLSRTRDPKIVERAAALAQTSQDADRDALIEAMARIPSPIAAQRLTGLARVGHGADRAKIAEALASHGASAIAVLVRMASDPDPSVRANAVWALGSVANRGELPALTRALADRDIAVAGNAAAALARLGRRQRAPVDAALCSALDDARSYVRANALAGLRVVAARCKSDKERVLLASDRSEVVRRAAALLLVHVSGAKDADRAALARCIDEDPSGSVAAACSEAKSALPSASEPVTVYVVPLGESMPVARAPFALVLADGLMRLGSADRRGAVFEHAAPRGQVSLAVPAPLAP